MGLIANYSYLSDANLKELKSLGSAKEEILDSVEEWSDEEDLFLDVDKMWDALHFVLTGVGTEHRIDDNPLSQAVLGVTPIEDISEYMAYTEHSQIADIVTALDEFDIEQALETFDMMACKEAELYPNKAPNTVDNFISLANSGFYDGLTIHRIVKGFVLQGGDPKGTGTGGPGYMIKGEFSSNGVENDIKHEEGILSMARSQNPDSAGSQFFIVTKEAPHLDGQYAAFGKVTKGLDVVHEIEKVSVGANDKPVEDVVIESIKVDTKGIEYKEPEKVK